MAIESVMSVFVMDDWAVSKSGMIQLAARTA